MYYLNWQKVKRNSTRSFAKFNGNLWVFVSSLWLIHLFEKCYFLTFERRWILTIIHILFSRVSFLCPLTSVPVSKRKTCWDEVESLLQYVLYPTKPYLHSPRDLLEVTKNFIWWQRTYVRHKRPRGICSLSGSRHYTKDLMESRDYHENRAVVSQHRRPKLSMRVKSCGFILRILKMAVSIKDLYGNSGKRFKKINTR